MVSELEGGWSCFINEHPHPLLMYFGELFYLFQADHFIGKLGDSFHLVFLKLKTLLVSQVTLSVSPFELGAHH